MHTQTSLVAEQIRLQQWAQTIRECQNRPSDMKVETWCENNGITKGSYYYHLRRVREACLLSCETTGETFVELSQPVPEHNSYASYAASDNSPSAKLTFINGITMNLYNTASLELIKNVMGAMGYAQ